MGDNGRMTTLCNIAASLPRLARERPDQIAIRCPGGRGANGMAAYDVTLSYAGWMRAAMRLLPVSLCTASVVACVQW